MSASLPSLAHRRVPAIVALGLLMVAGCTSDSDSVDSADAPAAGKADGLAAPSLLCDAQTWLDAVPVAGNGIMAYAGRAYVFADDGLTWAVVHGETATTAAVPLPEGLAEMRMVRAEITPGGRPLVTFFSEGQRYAALFDGEAFVHATPIGYSAEAHADANDHIYTIDAGGLGLVEYPPAGEPIYRGGLVEDPRAWGVGADGTVFAFIERRRDSTIHRGDRANDLVVRHLPHDSLSWSDDVLVASNEGYGFANMHLAIAQDGSLHIAYGLRYGTYYYRSADGETWEQGTPSDIVSQATLVDPASSVFDDDPRDVKGGIALLAAQDYDHASVTMAYHQGSFSVPSMYHLRRCEPFEGTRDTWPAERLSYGGLAAVDERGLATIVTSAGARQLAVDGVEPCVDDCGPDDPDEPEPDEEIPACGAADVYGPVDTPVNLASAEGYGHPLMPVGDDVRIYLANTPYWMDAAFGEAQTAPRPEPYADAESFLAHRSMSGGRTVVFQRGSTVYVSANDGPAIEAPCTSLHRCEARVAGDGHVWVANPDLHEQVGAAFEDRGGPPASPVAWDVDESGAVFVASSSVSPSDYRMFWRLAPGAVGWSRLGTLPDEIVDEVGEQIEDGFREGGMTFGADGSFHLFSDARGIGTGTRNKDQYYLRTEDYESWDVQMLPSIEALSETEDYVGWRYGAFWAASYDRVRFIVMTSAKPVYNGWDWNYPGSRQLDLIERCRDDAGDVAFAPVAHIRHPGWSTKGYYAFSRAGVASFLTGDGLTQAY